MEENRLNSTNYRRTELYNYKYVRQNNNDDDDNDDDDGDTLMLNESYGILSAMTLKNCIK